MKKIVFLVLVAMLMFGVPVFAGGPCNNLPQLNGTALVTSTVGGGIISGNLGNGGSFAFQKSNNLTIAGFGVQQNGNQVAAYTYGSSVGSTYGFAVNGLAGGFQAGVYSATATIGIPKQYGH